MTEIADIEALPPLYSRWLDAAGLSAIPREVRATCGDCPMCAVSGPAAPARPFRIDTKCCTYVPDLKNFLVGRILAAEGGTATPGSASVRARIAQRAGVSPLGVAPAPSFTVLYQLTREHNEPVFGRAPEWRCPHYLTAHGGTCGIWNSRNATCATFFCKHNRGEVGATFWGDVQRLLTAVEDDIAMWSAMKVGIDIAQLRPLLSSPIASPALSLHTELVPADAASSSQAVWGAWRDRECEFYLACWNLVKDWAWSDVLAIVGPRTNAALTVAHASLSDLRAPAIPRRIIAGRRGSRRVNSDTRRAETHSEYDPLLVPEVVWKLLDYFDGRPVEEVLERVATEEGIVLEPDLIRSLLDFQLLRPAPL